MNLQPNEVPENLARMENKSKFKQGIFLEMFKQDGILDTPMWLSLRDKPILVKHTEQATIFENANAALHILGQLDVSSICPGEGVYMSVSGRTYDSKEHEIFWKRIQEGTKEDLNHDYSHHLIQVRQVLEELEHALLNGPEQLVKTLPKELILATVDLNIAISKYIASKQQF